MHLLRAGYRRDGDAQRIGKESLPIQVTDKVCGSFLAKFDKNTESQVAVRLGKSGRLSSTENRPGVTGMQFTA